MGVDEVTQERKRVLRKEEIEKERAQKMGRRES